MTALTNLQTWMVEVLRGRADLSKSDVVATEAAVHFTGNDRLLPVEQAEIYREQFWLRHTSALVEDFPGLGGVLGQSDWERLVESYLAAYPPDSWTLRDLGNRLPRHVEECAWLPHHRLCIDMARLEWSYVQLFDARETAYLDANNLAAIPEDAWETAVIVMNPALTLLKTEYPVAELRRRLHRRETSVPIPPPDPQNLVLYRSKARTLHYDVVGDGARALLEALMDGLPLARACERSVSHVPDEAKAIEVSIGQWFREWAARGWIVDVTV